MHYIAAHGTKLRPGCFKTLYILNELYIINIIIIIIMAVTNLVMAMTINDKDYCDNVDIYRACRVLIMTGGIGRLEL